MREREREGEGERERGRERGRNVTTYMYIKRGCNQARGSNDTIRGGEYGREG